MIIPFNIKHRAKIESGEYKVRTASGKPARIVCWDMRPSFNDPILALITNSEGYEYTSQYTEDGRYIGNNENYLVIEDGRPAPEHRWLEKVQTILDSTASLDKVAEALLDAARHELNERILDGIAAGVSIHGHNGESRYDKPFIEVRPYSMGDKEYYGQ